MSFETIPEKKKDINYLRDREALPSLKEGYIRLVHLTGAENVESIISNGLDYRRYGMIQSMVRGWVDEDQVELESSDPRFQGKNMVAVVMDVPFQEARLHDNVTKSPGILSSEYIVGVVKEEKE